jgi:hypothetical protein
MSTDIAVNEGMTVRKSVLLLSDGSDDPSILFVVHGINSLAALFLEETLQ